MLKTERQRSILALCERYGTITVKFIQKELNVSDMTVRRDLEELAKQGKITRVHGGAQSIDVEKKAPPETESEGTELSHSEKKQISKREKSYIAEQAASMIEPGDTIFLGSGTTIELMTGFLKETNLRIVTNSLPVFNLLEDQNNLDLYLVGGHYRKRTGAFVGSIADETIQKLSIEKAFVGANGIVEQQVFTFNIEEGKFQQLVLDKARKKYLVADAHKFGHSDFYNFYDLEQVDALFTDQRMSESEKQFYQQYTEVFN